MFAAGLALIPTGWGLLSVSITPINSFLAPILLW
jgi:hypothetical protein